MTESLWVFSFIFAPCRIVSYFPYDLHADFKSINAARARPDVAPNLATRLRLFRISRRNLVQSSTRGSRQQSHASCSPRGLETQTGRVEGTRLTKRKSRVSFGTPEVQQMEELDGCILRKRRLRRRKYRKGGNGLERRRRGVSDARGTITRVCV